MNRHIITIIQNDAILSIGVGIHLDEYGDKGLVVIGISLDEGGPNKVRDFVKDMGIDYPVLMNDGVVDKQFGPIRSIPVTFIIDKKGDIINQIVGSRPKAVFEAEVTPLLK